MWSFKGLLSLSDQKKMQTDDEGIYLPSPFCEFINILCFSNTINLQTNKALRSYKKKWIKQPLLKARSTRACYFKIHYPCLFRTVTWLLSFSLIRVELARICFQFMIITVASWYREKFSVTFSCVFNGFW